MRRGQGGVGVRWWGGGRGCLRDYLRECVDMAQATGNAQQHSWQFLQQTPETRVCRLGGVPHEPQGLPRGGGT